MKDVLALATLGLHALAYVLAIYWLTQAVVFGDGPADVLVRARGWAAARGWIRLVESGDWCIPCASPWCAAIVGALSLVPVVGWPVVYVMAAAGAVTAAWEWMSK